MSIGAQQPSSYLFLLAVLLGSTAASLKADNPLVPAVVLLASDGASADSFGSSLALDGNTAVVGAPGHGGAQGTAFVFVRSGSSWTQQAQLTASDGVRGDQFGVSVSIVGGSIAIGASGKSSGRGAVYVFVQSGTAWSQQAVLTAADGASGDAFGGSVSMSGSTVLVGAGNKGSGRGGAYVFANTNGGWSQQATLSPSDAAAGDAFGNAVALNVDTAVVGALGKNNGQGAVYVFVRSSNAWSQQTKFAPSDLASDAQFGVSVAVNADTVVAGINSKSFATGAAYVFVRSGTIWNQQAKLGSPSDSGANAFGTAVAIIGDTLLCNEPANSQEFGEAYVFVRSGTTWTPQPKLTASDGAIGDVFGTTMALSSNTALFGSPNHGNSKGEAYAFVQSGPTFVQQAVLNGAGTSTADSFGTSVSVSGGTAVVGAPNKSSGRGTVYVFSRTGANWNQQSELTASDAANNDAFGTSVSIDGDTALIGASGKNGQGVAYVFVRSGSTWTQQAELAASDAASGDAFGGSVSLSGNTAVVGANGKLTGQGVAYVFVRSGATWTQQAKLTASDGVAHDIFGTGVSVSGDTALIGAQGRSSFLGTAYVFVRSGTAWTQQAELTPDPTTHSFAHAVSVDGDTALVGAYLDTGGSLGAAYVFVRSGTTWTRQAKLVASDGASGDILGVSVALNGDTALLGADGRNSKRGAAYVFTRSGSAWTQQFELTAPDAASGDQLGFAVAVNAGTILATSPSKASSEGEAYLYPFPIIAANGVFNGASFVAPVAPGSLATVFGNNFSTTDTSFSNAPLPTSLNNVSVSVNGNPVPLVFAGYTQVNFQMPYETPLGSANVAVTVNGFTTATTSVSITATAPGILVYGANRAIIQNADFSLNAAGNPAAVGTYVTVYVVGLGQLDNPIPTGAVAPGSPFSNAVVVPTATINGVNAPVVFAGMSPGFVGLAQVDVQIPSLPTGTYPIVIKQGGQASNAPLIDVTQ